MQQDLIAILDLGSKENSRLARVVREIGVYSEIYPHTITEQELKNIPNLCGIIINGVTNNIVDGETVVCGDWVYSSHIPVLTVAYETDKVKPDIFKLPEDNEELKKVIREFAVEKCGAKTDWNMKQFIADQVELIRSQVGNKKVLLAL